MMISRFSLGVLLLLIVVAIWTASTYLVKWIYSNDLDAPYFLTFTCNSLFVLYLPIFYLSPRARPRVLDDKVRGGDASISPRNEDEITSLVARASDQENTASSVAILRGFLRGDQFATCAKAAAIVSPLWFLANGAYNFSLKATSPSSNTIISSLSGLFTYALSLVILAEQFQTLRCLGVLICLLGGVLVGVADFGKDRDDEKAYGDIICLASSFLYASYTVAIRKYLPDDETRAPMLLFFGLLGAINCVVFGSIGAFLWFFGVEDLSGLTWKTLGLVLLKAVFDNLLSDFLWAQAVLLTSPTVATIALTLTIPGPLFIDAMTDGLDDGAPYRIAGGIAVITGFVLVVMRRD